MTPAIRDDIRIPMFEESGDCEVDFFDDFEVFVFLIFHFLIFKNFC